MTQLSRRVIPPRVTLKSNCPILPLLYAKPAAGPRTTLLCSTPFCHNVDVIPGWGPCLWSLHGLPMSVWVFSRYSSFLPHPKGVHELWTGVSALSQCEWAWVWLWERPCDRKVSCPGWVPTLHLSCWDRLWPPVTLNWSKRVGKEFSCLFLFSFPNCMYSSHVLQCLILEVFRTEVCLWFCARKYAVAT